MDLPGQVAKAHAFLELHRGPRPVIVPCAWDAGSARLLAGLGFAALGISSAGIAFGKGRMDGRGLLSRDEILGNAGEVVQATRLPVTGDLENGFGDAPAEVAATVRLAAQAGLAGGTIEDASGNPSCPVYPIDMAAERIAAGVQAAREGGGRFVLIARADNFLHGIADLDDTLARVQAYERAGADMAYVGALPSIDAVRRVCACVSIPVAVLVGRGGGYGVAELTQAGAGQITTGAWLPRLAYGEMLRGARELAGASDFGFLARAMPFEELNGLMEPPPPTS